MISIVVAIPALIAAVPLELTAAATKRGSTLMMHVELL
jgi:hypothetical protein